MTIEKALDSIEWHKSTATKELLISKKNIQKRDIVDMKIALDYISCE